MHLTFYWSFLALLLVLLDGEVEGWGRRRRRRACPVRSCSVSSWSLWSSCTQPCGTGGTQGRTRRVTTGAACGGSCSYALTMSQACNTRCYNSGYAIPGSCICKTGYSGRCCKGVDGGWSSWSSWSACGKSCDGGYQHRRRSCTRPRPSYGGKTCSGTSSDSKTCNPQHCPVNGHWSAWGPWSNCDRSCGHASKERYRTCTNPPPSYGGKGCGQFFLKEFSQCNLASCPGASGPIGIGCYGNSPNSFPDLLKDFRGPNSSTQPQLSQKEIQAIVQKCAQLAKQKKVKVFAVENYFKCCASLQHSYDLSVKAKPNDCRVFGNDGVGLRNFYYVYMFFG